MSNHRRLFIFATLAIIFSLHHWWRSELYRLHFFRSFIKRNNFLPEMTSNIPWFFYDVFILVILAIFEIYRRPEPVENYHHGTSQNNEDTDFYQYCLLTHVKYIPNLPRGRMCFSNLWVFGTGLWDAVIIWFEYYNILIKWQIYFRDVALGLSPNITVYVQI